MSAAPIIDTERKLAESIALAAALGAEAFAHHAGCEGGATNALAYAFLTALIDPMSPDLDYLRMNPAAAIAARAKFKGGGVMGTMTRDPARAERAKSDLSYAHLTPENLRLLRGMINRGIRRSGLMCGTIRASPRFVSRPTSAKPWADLRCQSYYFDDRQAPTFWSDGFVGFAWMGRRFQRAADCKHCFQVGCHPRPPQPAQGSGERAPIIVEEF